MTSWIEGLRRVVVADAAPPDVPLVTSSELGLSRLSIEMGTWPNLPGHAIERVASWMHQENGLLLALLALDDAPRRVALIQTSNSPYYVARQGPGYPGRGTVWRDFYYAAGYVMFDLVDKKWNSTSVELSQPASDGWPRDLAPALLEGIGHLMGNRRLSLQEIHVDPKEPGSPRVADAIALLDEEIQGERSMAHRALEVDSLDRAEAGLHDVNGIELFRVRLT